MLIQSTKTAYDATQAQADIFALLSDPTRLRILQLLFASKQKLCVGEVAEEVGISHSAASHQFAKLEAWQIVRGHREGQTVCYTIVQSALCVRIKKALYLF